MEAKGASHICVVIVISCAVCDREDPGKFGAVAVHDTLIETDMGERVGVAVSKGGNGLKG